TGGARHLRIRSAAGRRVDLPLEVALVDGTGRLPTQIQALIDLEPTDEREVLTIRHQALLGLHLVRDGARRVVIAEPPAILVAVESPRPEQRDALEAIGAARDAVLPEVGRLGLPENVRRALTQVLTALDQIHSESEPEDHITPDFARRLVAHGWLARTLGTGPATTTLQARVRAAQSLTEGRRFKGETSDGRPISIETLTRLGEDLVVRRRIGDTEVSEARRLPRPGFLAGVLDCDLRLEFDPEHPEAPPRAWAMECMGVTLSRVGADGRFECDATRWDQVFPIHRMTDAKVAPTAFPPHLLIVDDGGRPTTLVTAHGRVDAPKGGDPEDLERFLSQAATALTDTGHLDLIGEYFFDYVSDSPDPTRPWLVGIPGASGEIHQSIAQTLGTAVDGVCRGDCDDLAEVYQAVVTRQGRLGHIMNVPQHNTLAFAEPQGEEWEVSVLQTGPPYAFRAATIQEALRAAYLHFGVFENFDADQCPIALRFEGENTRTNWQLGWRIFTDPAYARTMIDVQRDWHFHTFAQAVHKMQALVASGDEDPANFRELAGLAERTGQHALAATQLREAMKRSDDRQLTLTSRLIVNLDEAGLHDEARQEIERALHELGDLRRAPEERLPTAMELAMLAATLDDPTPLIPLITDEIGASIGTEIAFLSGLLDAGRLPASSWQNDENLREIRRLAMQYAMVAMAVMENVPAEARDKHPGLVNVAGDIETWATAMVYRDPDLTAGGLSSADAILGQVATTLLGQKAMDALLEDAAQREVTPVKAERARGMARLMAAVPAIARSPIYWAERIAKLFDDDQEQLDRTALDRLALTFQACLDHGSMSALERSAQDDRIRSAQLMIALGQGRMESVRSHLRVIGERADRRERDATADLVGQIARHLDAETLEATLAAWHELVGQKPTYFAIAWAAARAKGHPQALKIAAWAAGHFPDDDAFAQEQSFMRSLLAP
ncbi:MAG: hypothetical protein KDB53_06975, partial [Planctomycetes bacterium]|nr:hypothetical protein [Planctomycetota bacterium]